MRIMTALRLARGFVVGAGVSGVIVSTAGPSAQTMSQSETRHSVRRALERLPYYGVFDFMAFGIERRHRDADRLHVQRQPQDRG